MRIAVAFPGCHRRGGVERVVFECARFLSSRGHDVHVLAGEHEPDAQSSLSHHLINFRRRPSFIAEYLFLRACERELSRGSYDVLSTHGCVCPPGGVHWVQSLHIAWLERCRSFRPTFSKARWKQRLNPLHRVLLHLESFHFSGRRYKKLIATTEHVKEDLNRYYGVPAADVAVIPNGFSPTEFSLSRKNANRPAMRSMLGLTDDQIAILFAANELERKGYATVLRAIRALGNGNIRLLVVGRCPVEEVTRLAEENRVGHLVIACGSTANIAEYHAAADIFVLPTQYEAFCLAILEALGSGLPVITSAVPGARDAIIPGVNGVIVNDPLSGEELAEAIRTLLDKSRREALSFQASASVAKYQWPVVLQSYENVLRQYANT